MVRAHCCADGSNQGEGTITGVSANETLGVHWGTGGANGFGQISYAINSYYTWSYYVNVVGIAPAKPGDGTSEFLEMNRQPAVAVPQDKPITRRFQLPGGSPFPTSVNALWVQSVTVSTGIGAVLGQEQVTLSGPKGDRDLIK